MADIYDEKDLKTVKKEEESAIKESDALYDKAIGDTDSIFQKGIDAYENYKKEQTDLQNKQTDFTIKQIDQQKEQAQKDYLKEQSAAYVDYQKQIDPHGVNAEQMAAAGLNNTGYSETSKVRMYNAYQNRVAVAREAYSGAVVSYNNAITQAQLQNSSALAEIAFNSLQQQLQLSLQGFQHKNDLLFAKTNAQNQIKDTYYSRRQDIIDQINAQNALAEEKRQFDILHPSENLFFKDDTDEDDSDISDDKVTAPRTSGKAIPIPVFSSREQAIDYLRENYNVPNATSEKDGIYTHSEWNKLKKSGSCPQIIKDSSSYEEYLQLHAEFLIEQYAQ